MSPAEADRLEEIKTELGLDQSIADIYGQPKRKVKREFDPLVQEMIDEYNRQKSQSPHNK